jgi:hypothetical protein
MYGLKAVPFREAGFSAARSALTWPVNRARLKPCPSSRDSFPSSLKEVSNRELPQTVLATSTINRISKTKLTPALGK